jgi:hypothetical protein
MQTAQTLPSNWRFKSSTSLKPTKLTPGSNGAKGWRYFACPVVASDRTFVREKNFLGPESATGFVSVGVVHASKRARQFQRAFPGFGSAVAEEGFVEAETLISFGQLGLIFMKTNLRRESAFRLLLQDGLYRLMPVAQRIHAEAAEEVEILHPSNP